MATAHHLDEAQFHTRFLQEGERIAEIAAEHGFKITPYWHRSLPHFSKLTSAKKNKIVDCLKLQREFFESAASQALPMHSPQLVWRQLARLNMIPDSQVFSKLTDEHTIEIFLKDGTSCFKNLKYFEHITLSLEDIFCLPFQKCGKFSLPGYLYFAELLIRLKAGQLRHTFRPKFSRFILQEKLGLKKKFWVELLFCSPLRRHGRTEALLLVSVNGPADSQAKIGETKSLPALP